MSTPSGQFQPQNPRDAKAQAKAEKAYRKASRPWYKKPLWWLLIGIGLLILLIIATCGGPGSQSTGGVSGDPSAPPAQTGPDFQGRQDGDVSAEAGQTISLDGVSTTSTPLEQVQPAIGSAQLCTTISIVNNTAKAVQFNGGLDWKLQNPQGAARNSTFGGSDTPLNSGELAPAGTVIGDVCFESDGAPGQYVVLYDPLFSFSADRAAWVNSR
jgi:septal ring-binding cell division protein DamX